MFQENEAQKILGDFGMQMDYLIQARRPDLMVLNEKKQPTKQKTKKKEPYQIVDFAVPLPSKKTKRQSRTWTLLGS